jgi:hypothetical protein
VHDESSADTEAHAEAHTEAYTEAHAHAHAGGSQNRLSRFPYVFWSRQLQFSNERDRRRVSCVSWRMQVQLGVDRLRLWQEGPDPDANTHTHADADASAAAVHRVRTLRGFGPDVRWAWRLLRREHLCRREEPYFGYLQM